LLNYTIDFTGQTVIKYDYTHWQK